ncbi:M64 family metallopeptidase [uncultured Alistipes sp.]|jgi:hypothetical protein|uniref:M64 family metallopeptidase n=1 Tax=uncultured Alistipes sp. TaxID=538949 RepID=UPI0025E75273|nr:M64 family metallopeptidase [uncultured Alistipes sp.]
MKRLFYVLLAAAALLVIGCSKNERSTPSLSVTPEITKLSFDSSGVVVSPGVNTFTVSTNSAGWDVELVPAHGNGQEWLSVVKNPDNTFTLTAERNRSADAMDAVTIRVTSTGADPIEISAWQWSDSWYLDGEVAVHQRFSAPDVTIPVNLVILADGFTGDDYEPGGAYDQAVEKTVDAFFSVEPYATYEKYFTVYKVVAYSEEEGATVENDFADGSVKKQTRNTAFGTTLAGGESTVVSCNYEKVFDYATRIPGITQEELPNTTIIVVVNLEAFAGNSYMWSTGEAIAMCCMGDRFTEIVCHEAGGHAFGRLYDEHVDYPDTSYPSAKAAELEEFRQGDPWKFGANLSLTNDRSVVHWRHYFTKAGYDMVGLHEGADQYGLGIWRPEENSCMRDYTLYFNAPSREAIVRRIMTITHRGFNRDDFYSKDKTDYPATGKNLSSYK